jgi:hypothetical protein
MRKFTRPALLGLAFIAILAATLRAALCCPFCSAPSLTMSEQVAQSDAIVLVQWVSGKMSEGQSAGETTYEIVKVVKQPDNNPKKAKPAASAELSTSTDAIAAVDTGLAPGVDSAENKITESADSAAPSAEPAKATTPSETVLQQGEKITLARYRAGKPGDLFLLMGTKGTVIEWSSPLEVTEASFQYITQAPSTEADPLQRLRYFVKFLEFPDDLVATDAYGEFANAPYKNITPLAKDLPREKILKWITDPKTPPTRLGLYGLLLGLCGNEDDAKLMAEKINEQTQDFRLGIDGIISGYLLLTGDKGLDVIDESKLRNKSAPFSETYAAMQALRFMWTYADNKIEKERLRTSMRMLLDRPELADLVIADLARWEDWSVQDKLMTLYGAEEYNIPSIKRAIVRFMLVSTKYKKTGDEPEPERVALGKKYVETLREKDPKTVKDAERFFFAN